MSNFQLSLLCLVITLGIYFANKRLYRRFRKLPLMPLVLTPALLVLMRRMFTWGQIPRMRQLKELLLGAPPKKTEQLHQG